MHFLFRTGGCDCSWRYGVDVKHTLLSSRSEIWHAYGRQQSCRWNGQGELNTTCMHNSQTWLYTRCLTVCTLLGTYCYRACSLSDPHYGGMTSLIFCYDLVQFFNVENCMKGWKIHCVAVVTVEELRIQLIHSFPHFCVCLCCLKNVEHTMGLKCSASLLMNSCIIEKPFLVLHAN